MTLTTALLALIAFLLGAFPFSLWIGYLILHKDIRLYGDGNPGAANVFRAGNPVVGMLAVLLDIFKGIPAVYFAARNFDLSANQLLAIAFCAILGHAFSPFLHLRGGKAVAVTFGALIGLMRPELLYPFVITSVIGLVILDNHSWVMLLAPVITTAYIFVSGAGTGALIFMLGIFALYVFKHVHDLDGWPRPSGWLGRRLRLRR